MLTFPVDFNKTYIFKMNVPLFRLSGYCGVLMDLCGLEQWTGFPPSFAGKGPSRPIWLQLSQILGSWKESFCFTFMNMMGLFQAALKENTQKEVCLKLYAPPLRSLAKKTLVRFLVCGHLCGRRCRCLRTWMCVSACDYSIITQHRFIQKKTAFSFPIKTLVKLSIGP